MKKPPRMRSMQARLTLLLGAIALLVSSLAGATLFWALKREVERQEITEVSGKLELIDHLIDMQNSASGLQDLAATFDEMRAGQGQLGIWILDAQGKVVYGGAAPETLETLPDRQVVLQAPDGGRMRGLRVDMNDRILPGAQLTVAVSTRSSSQFLYAYGTALALICALWVGATVMLAAWAVRRSMAPARRLSEQAARIQPDNLSRRLPLEDTDRELHELVRSFNRTLERLQEAYQQMEGFNADVAHELRTPLATLINGAQVMLSSPRSANELRDALESNLEELEDLKTLVNDMLFLARADRGERAADLKPVSLAAEARRVAEYYEATLEEHGVALRCEGDAAVAANPGLVRRALANLISNAIKATPRGGEIVLSCSASPAGARVEARNPGPPIPAADLPRIFDRFFRSGQARAPRSEGHGLGLAIVRAIARMHGGEVDAASDARGTVVGITLRGPDGHAAAADITKM
ncbi:Sensor kinase CusS [Achromobacter veterisilvae]|uniref:Sensor protein n=1 Tax=Achromobacter veterisilvae TaxID=2069367 RepID=A0A446CJH6_9BURK|nr:heavy metal sensor histidine kinase [Achromobacter veterisilvae]SSW67925.1 Sensor kinase CusS [Achromobacter veterisilvae]